MRAVVISHDGIRIDLADKTVSFRGGVLRFWKNVSFSMVVAVIVRRGITSHDELIEHVWGDDEGGGPEDPLMNFSVTSHRLNRRLAYIGLRLKNVWGRGFELAFLSSAEISRARATRCYGFAFSASPTLTGHPLAVSSAPFLPRGHVRLPATAAQKVSRVHSYASSAMSQRHHGRLLECAQPLPRNGQ